MANQTSKPVIHDHVTRDIKAPGQCLACDAYWRLQVPDTLAVLDEIALERCRQVIKWGEQDHPNGTGPDKLPMPDNSGSWSAAFAAERLKLATNIAAHSGLVTWLHILREEVFEAFAESDPVKLRTELIQVAAVATQWVEVIDRKNAAEEDQLRRIPTYPNCATCDGGGCGDCA